MKASLRVLSRTIPRSTIRPRIIISRPLVSPKLQCQCFTRNLSSTSALCSTKYTVSDLGTTQYHVVSDSTMEALSEYFEALIEDIGDDVRGSDAEYSAGVLTLRIGDDTYVINKQPPNKQIWLSSPKSGPKRYDFDDKTQTWFYSRDGSTLKELLDKELTELIHHPVDVDVGNA